MVRQALECFQWLLTPRAQSCQGRLRPRLRRSYQGLLPLWFHWLMKEVCRVGMSSPWALFCWIFFLSSQIWFCWILKWRLTSIKLNVYAIPKQHRRKQNIEIYGTKAHHYKSFQLKVHVKFCCFWSTLQPESDQHLISPYNTTPESDIKVKRSPVITNKTLQLSTWPHNTGRQIGDFPCKFSR